MSLEQKILEAGRERYTQLKELERSQKIVDEFNFFNVRISIYGANEIRDYEELGATLFTDNLPLNPHPIPKQPLQSIIVKDTNYKIASKNELVGYIGYWITVSTHISGANLYRIALYLKNKSEHKNLKNQVASTGTYGQSNL